MSGELSPPGFGLLVWFICPSHVPLYRTAIPTDDDHRLIIRNQILPHHPSQGYTIAANITDLPYLGWLFCLFKWLEQYI